MKTIFAISAAIFLSGCGCVDCQAVSQEVVIFALYAILAIIVGLLAIATAITIATGISIRSKPGDDIDPYDFSHKNGE